MPLQLVAPWVGRSGMTMRQEGSTGRAVRVYPREVRRAQAQRMDRRRGIVVLGAALLVLVASVFVLAGAAVLAGAWGG